MRNFFRSTCLLFFGLFLTPTFLAAQEIPVEKFFQPNQFANIKISPTGEYLAATLPAENRTVLVILKRSDMSVTGKVVLESKAHVGWFNWVNPERILFMAGKKEGRLSQPTAVNGIFGVNFDGSKQGRVDKNQEGVSKFVKFSPLGVMDTLRDDDNNVLVYIYNETAAEYQVNKMNVYTGKLTAIPARAPGSNATFYSDNKGVVRFVSSTKESLNTKLYYRIADREDWTAFHDQSDNNLNAWPIGYSADSTIVYLRFEEKSGPDAVYEFDSKTGQKKLLFKDDNVDPDMILSSPIDGATYGFRYLDGKPKIRYIDLKNPYATALQGLQASLPNTSVVPTSFTKDGSLGVYFSYSDTNLGDYYLYDLKANKASYLASASTNLEPDSLSSSKPISLKSRDNLTLHGFLTLPKGSNGKNLPLVLYPHGGPFGIFDVWGMDAEIQLLANRGYAVLQVNFRGSGNYGRAFAVDGYGEWGGKMQDDLTDATRWAINSGIANPKRICIYGASYGAYAALRGVVKEPDLYACAIGNIGVYDLPKTYSEGAADSRQGKNIMDRYFGNSARADNSPNKLADRIRVPILLAAGDEDDVAPIAHTKMMNEALKRLGKSVEMVIYEKEGHGNYLIKNRIDFANRVLGFLDKNIGPNSPSEK